MERVKTVELRRVIVSGGSYLVVLPKRWAISRKLERGQPLKVTAEENLVTVEPLPGK